MSKDSRKAAFLASIASKHLRNLQAQGGARSCAGRRASIDVDRPDVLVGRHTECDVRLPLPDVSRRHCRLRFVAGGWQVIDLSSLNGTQVNGQPVEQSPLKPGDQLKIGGFHFEVTLAAGKPHHGGHVESILETLAGGKRRAS